ncbi:MAG: lysozyme inhibitor LprI family protein [Gammaproteobacteria bacterium]|nr:lysozyme inhibitor LprI family protein [Gammaproteobacteria bacterium]
MKATKTHTLTFFSLLIMILQANACHASNNSTNSMPEQLIGQWLVTDVKINTNSMRTQEYHYNDPRLAGRVFTFSRGSITDNTPESEKCTTPVFKKSRMLAADLWTKSMGATADDAPPTPYDYELSIKKQSEIEVNFFACIEGLYGGALGIPEGIEGAWLVSLDTDQFALRWYGETILILKKISQDQMPVASFNCSKAGTETEKTICGSIALAAYDKSLAKAYISTLKHLRLEGDQNALQQFKQSQKDWLKRRNACGKDIKCLQKIMQDRLNVIFDR